MYADYDENSVLLDSNKISNLLNEKTTDNYAMRYYKIDSVIDLLSATCQEAFAQKRIIKNCQYCKRYYITDKRTDTKYCNLLPINNKNSCDYLADLAIRRVKYWHHKISALLHSRLTYDSGVISTIQQFQDDYHLRKKQLSTDLTYTYKKHIAWLQEEYAKLKRK